MRAVHDATDVDEQVLALAEETEEWFPGRIDWDEFWDRLETAGAFVGDVSSPAAAKIQRHIRALRRG